MSGGEGTGGSRRDFSTAASARAIGPKNFARKQALARLRSAIDRSQDKGTIVEFVQQRDSLARRGEVPLDHVRDRLRSFRAIGLPLDSEGALSPPPYPHSRERAVERAADRLPSSVLVGPNQVATGAFQGVSPREE